MTLPVPSATGGGGDQPSRGDSRHAGIGVGPHQAKRTAPFLVTPPLPVTIPVVVSEVSTWTPEFAPKVTPRSVVAAEPL